jgi:ubiquinone/menaquinone biosynthesis C-methylase UbiE
MASKPHKHRESHDWHSHHYVDEWIGRDVTRDDERRPRLRQMLSFAPLAPDVAIEVLDVGAGYGVVTEELFKVFPNARVTLQDYSAPMFEHARQRLAIYSERTRYVTSDLSMPSWVESAGGPFDLAVSAIAIHNLREEELSARVYRDIRELIKPNGAFLNYELVVRVGLEAHKQWLRRAGFVQVECPWQEGHNAILAAYV